jgi:hypothetical protein
MQKYTIESILDIINVSKKYNTGRKRPRETRVAYNFDVERLSNCIEPLKKLNDLVGMEDIKKNIAFLFRRIHVIQDRHIQ